MFKPWEYVRVHRSRVRVIIGGEGMIARIFVITITMDTVTFHNKLAVVLNSKHPLLLEPSKKKSLWIYGLKQACCWLKVNQKFGSIMLYTGRARIDRSWLTLPFTTHHSNRGPVYAHIHNGAISPGWTIIQIFQTQLELIVDWQKPFSEHPLYHISRSWQKGKLGESRALMI